MTARVIQVESEAEVLVVEQALAMYRELNRTCKLARDGEVLNLAEQVAVERGRELTRKTLEAVLQDQAYDVEKGGASSDVLLSRIEAPPRQQGTNDPHGDRARDGPARLLCLSEVPHRVPIRWIVALGSRARSVVRLSR